jgi:hypothetical protein
LARIDAYDQRGPTLNAISVNLIHDHAAFLAPGETGVIAIIASDRRQGRVILRYIVGLLRSVAMLEEELDGEPKAESVMLRNGVVIEIHTGSIGSPRGRTFIAVLCDEIAFWSNEDSANPDTEVIAAVRPGLISIPYSMLLMASSPYSKRGVLWRTFRQHWAKDDSRVLVWRGTTVEMNPGIDPDLIAKAYEDDPQSAASEYGAEFRSDISGYIDREVVEQLMVPGRFELPRIEGAAYSAFVDPSGGSHDSFTLAIGHAEGSVAVLDVIREQRPPFSPAEVVSEFSGLLQLYGIVEVHGDRYAAEFSAERFRDCGINYIASERPKSQLYQELLPLINSKRVELLDNSRLLSQLCGLERRTARGGKDSIDHGAGGHDDVSNAVAGVLVQIAGQPDAIEMWTRAGVGFDRLLAHMEQIWRREGRLQ